MRTLLIFSSVVVAGCASAGMSPSGPEQQTISGGSAVAGSLTMTSSTTTNYADIAAPLDRVWKVLPAAFDSLGITVASVDPATHTIGNEGYKLRQRLGRVPLSRFLDCGTTQVGANADSYEVFLTVMVQARAGRAPGTTSMSTLVEATARSIAFSQAPSKCNNLGVIESRLIEAVKAQITK